MECYVNILSKLSLINVPLVLSLNVTEYNVIYIKF
jgi:hypothetical protein